MPAIDYVGALERAKVAPVPPVRASGCGRVYIVPEKAHKRGLKAACAKVGMRWLADAYGSAKGVIYVGYDNADGRALAKGAAMVEALKAEGIDCYRDEVAD